MGRVDQRKIAGGKIIRTSAEVTLNGGLVRDSLRIWNQLPRDLKRTHLIALFFSRWPMTKKILGVCSVYYHVDPYSRTNRGL